MAMEVLYLLINIKLYADLDLFRGGADIKCFLTVQHNDSIFDSRCHRHRHPVVDHPEMRRTQLSGAATHAADIGVTSDSALCPKSISALSSQL